MDHPQFDQLIRRLSRQTNRRGLLVAGRGLGLSLLGLAAAAPPDGEAKKAAKRRRQHKQDEKQKAKKRVNQCLANDVPRVCACTPSETARCRRCYDEVSACCYQMEFSRQAGCTCIAGSGWGYCTA
jgi:hypothetical protein